MNVKEDAESKWDWTSSRKIGFSCTNVMEGKKHSWWREQLDQMAATVLTCQASSLPTREVSLLNLLLYQTHTQPNLRISPASSLLEKENHIHYELLTEWSFFNVFSKYRNIYWILRESLKLKKWSLKVISRISDIWESAWCLVIFPPGGEYLFLEPLKLVV